MLSGAIREIHNHNASNLSFEETYRHAYNLVLNKQGEFVYRNVNELVAKNIQKLAREKVQTVFPDPTCTDQGRRIEEAEQLLRAIRAVWDDHKGCMKKLGQVLDYVVSKIHSCVIDVT